MTDKYTVKVRIKVKGSKRTTTGYSSFDRKSYNKKFKDAVLNAVYNDYANRHKKLKYDTDWDYTLTNAIIVRVGKKDTNAKRGVNKKLHNEILIDKKKVAKKNMKKEEKNVTVSSKDLNKQLYGASAKKKPVKRPVKRQNYEKLKKKELIRLLKQRSKR